jgi:hypothetical protein
MISRKAFAVLGLALGLLVALPNARATEVDQATKVTFSQAVQIPGRVLPAGTYLFVADQIPSEPPIVRIYSSDRSRLYATLMTISAERLQSTEKTEIAVAARGPMQPAEIVTWFYTGRTIGQEFIYSRRDRNEAARNKQERSVITGN